MARTATTRPAATLQDLDPDTIAPHPKNPRHSLGDLKELTASIAEQGVLEPIVVEPFPDDTEPGARKWLLIHGHRRLAAAQAAGLTSLPAMVQPEASSLEDQVARMLVENLQRAGLTAVEEGDAYQELLDLGWDTATISQRVSRPKTKVAALVKVAGLPESARERISEGQLTLEDAQRMAKFAGDAAAIGQLQKAADLGKWQFDNQLAELEMRKKNERELAKIKKDLKAKGIRILSREQTDDLDDWVALEDLPASALGAADDLDPDSANDQEWKRVAVEAHKDCPGAFAHVEVYGNRIFVEHGCAEPLRHPHDSTAAGATEATSTLSEEEAARRRETREQEERARAELQLQLGATAVARRHFLGDVINAPEAEDVARALIMRKLKTVLAGKTQWALKEQRILAEVVLPNATQDSLDRPGLADRIRKAIDGMTAVQLVLVSELNLSAEDSLATTASGWKDTENYSICGNWLQDVPRIWGYKWSDFEQSLIDGNAGAAS